MKRICSIIAMVALVAAILACFAGCEQPEEGKKTITVSVTYQDGSTKDFTYTTEELYLGPVLREEGLVEGHYDGDSFYIDAVDGLAADYSANESWWKILDNGTESMKGVDEIPLKDGGKYQFVYTIGF